MNQNNHSMIVDSESEPTEPNIRDRIENFSGKQLLYVGWDHHTMICAPIALLVAPDLKFRELVVEVLPKTAFALHPDWPSIDWRAVEWRSTNQVMSPDEELTLKELHIGHKHFLRMHTPNLRGISGAGSQRPHTTG